MTLITVTSVAVSPPCLWKGVERGKHLFSPSSFPSNDLFRRNDSMSKGGGFEVRACLFNPNQQPILKEALKEPVAFVGGIFAGLLRLDLKEDPLKEWVVRTVEASGITEEEISKTSDVQEQEEEMPVQIEIE
ncbi:hypothetical protein ACJIZ3_010064 [Penstemon smallii]|uniref:Uncharacterized protein n=1 Tax=Penstemon smallii TaxID=265156 RepID=A0ABD3TFM2_9LAMI